MNNDDLDRILRTASVPERPAADWERFPERVVTEARRRRERDQQHAKEAPEPRIWEVLASRSWLRPALAAAAAIVGLAGAVTIVSWKNHPAIPDSELAEVRKYYREITDLFPNQLRVIAFEPHGARLMLADQPNVPPSQPIYIKVRTPRGCQAFLTFSGQQIQVNGDTCDVMLDGRGNVMLVGPRLLWADGSTKGIHGEYRIDARTLERT